MSTLRTAPHLRDCFLAALGYVATTWVCIGLLRHALVDAPTVLRAAIALLPVVPIVLATRAVVRLVRAGDELQRRIDLEALVIAGVVVGLACLTASLLEAADVIELSARQALIWIFPAQWIAYVLARVWTRRRYA